MLFAPGSPIEQTMEPLYKTTPAAVVFYAIMLSNFVMAIRSRDRVQKRIESLVGDQGMPGLIARSVARLLPLFSVLAAVWYTGVLLNSW
jgi:hypothetical protein